MALITAVTLTLTGVALPGTAVKLHKKQNKPNFSSLKYALNYCSSIPDFRHASRLLSLKVDLFLITLLIFVCMYPQNQNFVSKHCKLLYLALSIYLNKGIASCIVLQPNHIHKCLDS